MLLVIILIKCTDVNRFGLSSWKHLIGTAEGVVNSFKNLGSDKNALGEAGTGPRHHCTLPKGSELQAHRPVPSSATSAAAKRVVAPSAGQQDTCSPSDPQGGLACLQLASEGVEPWTSSAKAQVSAHQATGQSTLPLRALWAGEPASYAGAPVCHLSQTILLSSLSPTVHSGHLWTCGRSTCLLACSATCSLILPASLHASWQITTLSNKLFFTSWHFKPSRESAKVRGSS